jgi:hypothetical protein
MQPWIEEELQTADLPDERLNNRYRIVLDRLSDKPTLSIPAACVGWAETQAAYRFCGNRRVKPKRILKPHRDATLQRIRRSPVVLISQDTSELELTRAQEKIGGPLGSEQTWGCHDHVSLAVTPEHLPLGVIDSHIWARDLNDFHKRKQARFKSIEVKESYRWLEGYRRACEVAAEVPETQIVSLSDSEGDIYECFAEAATVEGVKAEFIIRACQDRSVISENTGKLWETVAASPILGTFSLEVGSRPAHAHDTTSKRRQPRAARTATVTVQACTVTLKPPWRPKEVAQLPEVTINVVLVRETDPPEGEPPIEWLLLTSLPISTYDEALKVIQYYTCRWDVEVFFRVLKSGCKVEDLQFETLERFANCLTLYLIVAWRVLYVMRLGRECPELPCEAVFAPEEWQAVYQISTGRPAPTSPKEMPKLGEILIMVAKLGGYLGREGDGPPGPQTVWIGLQRTRDFAIAWTVFQQMSPRSP